MKSSASSEDKEFCHVLGRVLDLGSRSNVLRAGVELLHRDLSRRLNTETLGTGKSIWTCWRHFEFPVLSLGPAGSPNSCPSCCCSSPGAIGAMGERSQGFLLREGRSWGRGQPCSSPVGCSGWAGGWDVLDSPLWLRDKQGALSLPVLLFQGWNGAAGAKLALPSQTWGEKAGV